MFDDQPFRDAVKLAAVNSINWARLLAQVVYYFAAALALGAPHRKVSFTVPTGNFGDIFAGYVAAHGPADRAADRRHQRKRHPPPRAGDRALCRARASSPPSARRWTSRSRSNFERLLFDALRPRRRARRGADGRARSQAASRSARARSAALRDDFASGPPPREDETAARSPAPRGDRRASTRTPRSASSRRGAVDPAVPMVTLATAHPAKFPDAVERATGLRPALPAARRRPVRPRGALHRGAERSRGDLQALIRDRTRR